MPNYAYTAIDVDGRTILNDMDAPNEKEVIQHLQRLSLVPVEISVQKEKAAKNVSFKKIKIKDIILFTRQLNTLLRSGVPILVSLNALKEQAGESPFKVLLERIAREVEQGNAFSTALEQYPKIFPSLYINAVKVGEMSGTLEETLLYLANYLEEEQQMKQSVKKALRYPMMVIIGLVVAFLIFTMAVIPRFIPIFEASGLELPLPSRVLIGLYYILSTAGIPLLLITAVLITGLIWYIRRPSGRFMFHKLQLQAPIFGPLLRKVSMARFAKVLSTMNRTGIPVVKALDTMKDTMENEVYRRELDQVLELVKEGSGIASAVRRSPYFSPFVVEMLGIGEKSGALDEMLDSISQYYDMEVNETVKNMTALIEPVITVFLGGMVLLLALAIFLPMWDMMSIV
ncbi:MAG: type II secretion system F family protein [Calditrichia bacterium]